MDIIADKLKSNGTVTGWAGPGPLVLLGIIHQYPDIPAEATADATEVDTIAPADVNFCGDAGCFGWKFGARLLFCRDSNGLDGRFLYGGSFGCGRRFAGFFHSHRQEDGNRGHVPT